MELRLCLGGASGDTCLVAGITQHTHARPCRSLFALCTGEGRHDDRGRPVAAIRDDILQKPETKESAVTRLQRAKRAAREYVRKEALKIDDDTLAGIVRAAFDAASREDDELCDQCGEAIPIVAEGGLANHYHAPSCLLHYRKCD